MTSTDTDATPTPSTPTLAGRRVLVIGGSKFLGAGIARRVRAAGAEVVIGARDLDRARDVADQLEGRAVSIDVTDESTLAEAASALGAVDHVVVTAAAHHNVPVTELQHEGISAALEAKVTGPLLVAKHFSPIMPADGSFLFFSGVAAWRPAPGFAVMGITNGAVSFLATHLAVELAPQRVNALAPGIIDSGTWDELGAQAKQEFLDGAAQTTLAGRAGRVEDIADAALGLLTSSFISGETLHVDGGATHRMG